MIRARVFVLDDNRFLVPGYWYDEENSAIGMGSALHCMTEAMLFAAVLGMKCDGFAEFEVDPEGNAVLMHLSYSMYGRQFAHGQIDLYLISGPLFDFELNQLRGD